MNPWGWQPTRARGLWDCGPRWMGPFSAAVPWITVLVCLVMLHFVGKTLTVAEGILFELPDSGLTDTEATQLIAVVLPTERGMAVLFDDARYTLSDTASSTAFGNHLAERVSHLKGKTLLLLADRRINAGELARLAGIARLGGVQRILFANKNTGDASAE